jgi:signal transduction histidine kinase
VSRPDVEVLLTAAAYSGAVAVIGLLAGRLWRRRSVRAALLAVALVAVLTVVAGVVGAAEAMFISGHDLAIVLQVSAVAGVVALAVALMLGRGVMRDVEVVRGSTRTLLEYRADPGPGPRTAELADIHGELRHAGRLLAEGREREQMLEASRRELVAWVSHDLRTPLAGLRAMAEALEDGLASDPPRYFRQIRREVDLLGHLIDDLFELSRIQSGRLSLTLEPIDLRALVADVVGGSGPMAEARRVALTTCAGPTWLDADPAGLSRVLSNLVINAIRHTPSDGTVEVLTSQEDEHILLSVSDGCGGVAAEDLDRLFEPGWRGTPARTPGPDAGAGLGLAIARGIVEAHHGRISVHNTDRGCRFDVRLPSAPDHGPRRPSRLGST